MYSVALFCVSSRVSVLLFHTVLSALHQEKLVTEDAIERMKGERRDLSDSVVLIQCSMPSKVVARTANVLDRYGHNEEARQLRG